MKRAILQRLESGDQGTFGRLFAPGLTLFTGELPWRENRPNVSCIPAGTYRCVFTYSPRFKKHLYLVEDVDGRAGVRKHAANFMGDVEKGFRSQLNGCIALGEKLGWIDGQKALLLSLPAVRRLESVMERKPFLLEVRNA